VKQNGHIVRITNRRRVKKAEGEILQQVAVLVESVCIFIFSIVTTQLRNNQQSPGDCDQQANTLSVTVQSVHALFTHHLALLHSMTNK
jgi:hypothetical protein